MSRRPDLVEQEAREAVQLRLGALSLVLWLLVAFTLVALLTAPHATRAPQYLQIGSLALLLAALPWLGYRRWVAVEARRRRARAEPPGRQEAE